MENRKKVLGKGLEQLFNSENLDLSMIEEKVYEDLNPDEILDIKLEDLRANPYQPRKQFDEEALNELADSIVEHGVFQPIIVKKSIKGYEIIAGERRFRASKLAGKTTIPAIVRDFTDGQMMEIALLENIQREDLNAIEEALAYRNMITKLNLTQEQLSKKVGKSRSHITNIIGLLKLPVEVQKLVANKDLSMGHARVLSKLEDKEEILNYADKIVKGSLPVRNVENLVSTDHYKETSKKVKKSSKYRYVEDALQEKFDTKVKISENKVVISFTNDADLNRLLEIMEVKDI